MKVRIAALAPGVVLGTMLATPATAAGPTVLAVDSPVIEVMMGPWDLTLPARKLVCRIQLSKRQREPKLVVGIPQACRQAMRAITAILSWSMRSDGAVVFADQRGKELATFLRAEEGQLKGSLAGEEYTLRPVAGGRFMAGERAAAVDAAVQRLARPDMEDPRIPARLAARYALFRAGGAATGCTLLLDTREPGPGAGTGRARLDGACPDQGLRTFDPAGWFVERDRLFLIARRGHRTGFNIERDGSLTKDPPAGAPLLARRLTAP